MKNKKFIKHIHTFVCYKYTILYKLILFKTNIEYTVQTKYIKNIVETVYCVGVYMLSVHT